MIKYRTICLGRWCSGLAKHHIQIVNTWQNCTIRMGTSRI